MMKRRVVSLPPRRPERHEGHYLKMVVNRREYSIKFPFRVINGADDYHFGVDKFDALALMDSDTGRTFYGVGYDRDTLPSVPAINGTPYLVKVARSMIGFPRMFQDLKPLSEKIKTVSAEYEYSTIHRQGWGLSVEYSQEEIAALYQQMVRCWVEIEDATGVFIIDREYHQIGVTA